MLLFFIHRESSTAARQDETDRFILKGTKPSQSSNQFSVNYDR